MSVEEIMSREPVSIVPRAAFVYTDDFSQYRLGPDHPFNPLRLELTVDLMEACGVLSPREWVTPRPATREELLTAHSAGYIRAVEEAGSTGEAPRSASHFNLGTEDNPIFPMMHEATSLLVGATLTAAELVMGSKVEHAVNIAGGLHHAMPSRASGFCIYNDISVAIHWIQKHYGGRIIYIDTDAHHGDGPQWAFYDDPTVLTVSFHETGRFLFPGTGYIHERGKGDGIGYSFNVPLETYTGDGSWIECLDRTLPALFEAFRPDVVISQHGCDGHALDPLSHLQATLRTYKKIPSLVHQLAHKYCQGRWVILGGGGYDIWRVVPRAWTTLWAEASGQPLPAAMPETWLGRYAERSPVTLPVAMMDDPSEYPAIPSRTDIEEKNRLTAEYALSEALKLIRDY